MSVCDGVMYAGSAKTAHLTIFKPDVQTGDKLQQELATRAFRSRYITNTGSPTSPYADAGVYFNFPASIGKLTQRWPNVVKQGWLNNVSVIGPMLAH